MQTKRDSNSSRFLRVVSGDIFKKYCVSQDLLANTVSACRHFLKCFDYKEWARGRMGAYFHLLVLPINLIPNSNWLHTRNKCSCKTHFLS